MRGTLAVVTGTQGSPLHYLHTRKLREMDAAVLGFFIQSKIPAQASFLLGGSSLEMPSQIRTKVHLNAPK